MTDPTAPDPTAPDPTAAVLPVASPTALRLDDAFLLRTGPGGPSATPGLHLQLDQDGLALSEATPSSSDGGRGRHRKGASRAERRHGPVGLSVPWAEIARLSADERATLPDGRAGVAIVVTTRQTAVHRVVVPGDEPAALEATVEALARRFGQHPAVESVPDPATGDLPDRDPAGEPRRSLSALVVAPVLVGLAGVVAILLLAAGHVVHL